MGFSDDQIMSLPFDQLLTFKAQFDNYEIPQNIVAQIKNLSETNGRLNLNGQGLTTGQLCKILNALNEEQRSALTRLYLNQNQLTSLPDSFGNLGTLTELNLAKNKLTSLLIGLDV